MANHLLIFLPARGLLCELVLHGLFTQKGTGKMLVVVVSGLVECRYHTLHREALTHAVLKELDWVCTQGPAA